MAAHLVLTELPDRVKDNRKGQVDHLNPMAHLNSLSVHRVHQAEDLEVHHLRLASHRLQLATESQQVSWRSHEKRDNSIVFRHCIHVLVYGICVTRVDLQIVL